VSRGRRGLLPALALLLLVTGCGDPVLWARWRAERALWHAQREANRTMIRPRAVSPQDYARAEAAFRAIVAEFPAERWARRDATAMELDVAEVSGRAALALARLAELQSRGDEAVAGYARVESDWAALVDLALEAAVLRAEALERLARPAEAANAWERVLRDHPAFEAHGGGPRRAHLEALRRLAAGLASAGRSAGRDSLLAEAEQRFAGAAARTSGRATVELLDGVAECRFLRGDLDGSVAIERQVLASKLPIDDTERARRRLALGERLLAAGRADSALACALQVGREAFGDPRLAAYDLEARAQVAAGRPNAALEAYGRILSDFPRQPSAGAEARFARGRLLESLDRWTLARTEYSALCAAHPSHPRALEAWLRVVRHHRAEGEAELARIETEHALGSIDQLVAMQHDPVERGRMVEGRAAILLAGGRTADAIRELQGLWSSLGLSAEGARLGAAAAEAAERELGDRALALRLWQILARSSPDAELRRRAAAEIAS